MYQFNIIYNFLDDFDPTSYFTLEKGTDSYTISVKTSLPDSLLKTRKYLLLTVKAQLNKQESEANIVISLPSQEGDSVIQFEQILYKGQYKDKKLTYDTIRVDTTLTDDKVAVKFKDGKTVIPLLFTVC